MMIVPSPWPSAIVALVAMPRLTKKFSFSSIAASPLTATLIVWLVSLAWSGFVGLSTVLAALSLPFAGIIAGATPVQLIFATLAALFIAFTHRGNLLRVRAGTEPRAERVRVLGRIFSRGKQ